MRQTHGDFSFLRYLKDAVSVPHEALCLHGEHHPVFVIPCSAPAPLCVLEQTVVTLRVKQAGFVKARTLKLMIYVCGDHKVVFVLHQCKQFVIHRLRRINIAVKVDVSRPPGPASLLVRERPEAAGIHVRDTETLNKIEKIPLKPFAAVGQARRCGEARARADHDRVRGIDLRLQSG